MEPLYNSIGLEYGVTRHADPAICRMLAQLAGIRSDGEFLDVACGTGNYTCALAESGGRWRGLDISEEMLRQAAAKRPDIDWTPGSADALPYPDGMFNGAICTLAIHHFPDISRAFREVFRVLDDGAFVIFTAFPEQMRNYWLCHYFPEMMERSIQQMPAREDVVDALLTAGFDIGEIVPFHVTNDLQDLFLYSGKERPHIYLDPVVRSNISSFAVACPAAELQSGLPALQADLENDTFQAVTQGYSGDVGDYAFIVARKTRV